MLINNTQPFNGTELKTAGYLSAQVARSTGVEPVISESDRNLAYDAALKLVARIDEELTRGIRHYRDKAGRLLTKLDEVIRAILADNLRLDDEEEEEV